MRSLAQIASFNVPKTPAPRSFFAFLTPLRLLLPQDKSTSTSGVHQLGECNPLAPFQRQVGFRARLATDPGHSLYHHENNTQTSKALFSILHTVSRGAPLFTGYVVAVARRPAPSTISRYTTGPSPINGQLSAPAAPP